MVPRNSLAVLCMLTGVSGFAPGAMHQPLAFVSPQAFVSNNALARNSKLFLADNLDVETADNGFGEVSDSAHTDAGSSFEAVQSTEVVEETIIDENVVEAAGTEEPEESEEDAQDSILESPVLEVPDLTIGEVDMTDEVTPDVLETNGESGDVESEMDTKAEAPSLDTNGETQPTDSVVDTPTDLTNTNSESDKPSRKVDSKEPRHTLYVGNLPFSTTVQNLRSFLSEHIDIRYVALARHPVTGNTRGFAYVDVNSEEEVVEASEKLNGVEWEGRKLRVSKFLPKGDAGRERNTPQNDRLFVGSVPFETTAAELKEFFAQYGQVNEVVLPLDPSGESRGFAFVLVKEEDLEHILSATDGAEFQGRSLAVRRPWTSEEKADRQKSLAASRTSVPHGETRVWVGNISFYTNEGTLTEIFEEFGKVHDVFIPTYPENGSSRGFAFVTMSAEAAEAAIAELNDCELDGRIIKVNVARKKNNSRYRSSRDDFDGQ